MKKSIYMIMFIIGAIVISCSNNKKNVAEEYINLMYLLNKNKIIGQTDLSVNWREQTLLFWIQVEKDSISMPFYIKERKKQLILKSGKKWIYLDSLQSPKVAILDSIYLQKDRIEYYYFLMNKYPLKKIQYSARMKTIRVDIDTFKFINVSVPPILMENKLRKLNDNWWVYN